jgi:hypothetical protein
MDLFVAATFLFVVGTLFVDFALAMLVAWYSSNVQILIAADRYFNFVVITY